MLTSIWFCDLTLLLVLKRFFHKSKGYSRSVQIASNYPTFHFKPCLTPIFKECWVTEAFTLDGYGTEANGVHYYRPQTKLWKGNVFTPVCQSFCSQERVSAQRVCISACTGQTPTLRADTPTPSPPGGQCRGRHAAYWNAFLYYTECSFAKVMFLHVSVILFTGGVLPHCMLGYTPRPQAGTPPRPQAGTSPPDQRLVPPRSRHPPWDQRQAPPQSRHPPLGPKAGTPPEQTPPLGTKGRHPPPWTRGRYPPPRADHPGSRHPPAGPEAGTPPPVQCMLGDAGNKRAVRILLECNLVLYRMFYIAYEPRGSGSGAGRNRLQAHFQDPIVYLVVCFNGIQLWTFFAWYQPRLCPWTVQCDYIIWDTVLV